MPKRSKDSYKSVERSWAETLGAKRIPVSGRARGDVPDLEGSYFVCEVKWGQRLLSSRVKLALQQAQAAATKSGKLPLVCLEESRQGSGGNIRVVVIPLDAFVDYFVGTGGPVKPFSTMRIT